MPLIETKGAASAQGFGGAGAGASGPVTYIEDVFSTWLVTPTSSNTNYSVTNGIDVSGKGGMVWMKARNAASTNNLVYDTARGASAGSNNALITNSTSAQQTAFFDYITGLSNGFTVNFVTGGGQLTNNGINYASWTFRKQPKFFDIVTYTGNGTGTNIGSGVLQRDITHNLTSTPGCVIIKNLDTSNWVVYHRSSTSGTKNLRLNTTDAGFNASGYAPIYAVSSTTFSVIVGATGLSSSDNCNLNGATYVAYLFAHNAGGFGLSGTDNVISCGSFTTDGSGNATVTLGYEPQWVMCKASSGTAAVSNWITFDSMRNMVAGGGGNSSWLYPNTSGAEVSTAAYAIKPNATGMTPLLEASTTYIYIAIRRGPMKVPTSGTSVFNPVVYTGTNVDNRLVNMSLLTDMTFARQRDSTTVNGMVVGDRLRGDPYLLTASTNAENSDPDSFMTPTVGYGTAFSSMVGFGVGNDATSRLNISTTSNNQIAEGFRRAPGFFDEVCYTGTTAQQTISHNLAAVPELIIAKVRGNIRDWVVYYGDTTKYLNLNLTAAPTTDSGYVVSTSSTNFVVGASKAPLNENGENFVAYLFATCAGVSKVGSYTGTGALQTVDCGFTGGARFVLIKRTDSTGDWYVYDSARGISSSNDPYLFLNSTAAEVTGTNYVDTTSVGFQVTAAAPAELNANGGTYIFLAIA